MNENEFDQTARAWLDDGPTRMSDRALLSAFEEIHTTRQRRAIWPAWRATPVSSFIRLATAAVLVVGVGLLAITVVPRLPDGPSVGGPSPSPSAAQAVDFPNLTKTFVSPRNGFSIKHPDRVALTPAEQLWGFSKQVDDAFDVVDTGLGAVFKGASAGIAYDFIASADISIDEWVDDLISGDYIAGKPDQSPGACGVPRSQQAEITIDGQSGRISECPNEIEATVVFGGRAYYFTLSHNRSDARAVFDAFAATIDLTPETAVDFPGLTTTFVSPTNGFSFGYFDRAGGMLTPAKGLWDPVNEQADDGFDVVNPGISAIFKAASTEIPDGISLDEFVDEYVSRPSCGTPLSQQAEITIDGQSGRISECPNEIEATVVAGGRIYLFILLSDGSDARAFFEAFAATIDLRPEDAAVPSISPSS
jgi:hypothetical protein